jgi:hypothetical protein
MSSIVLRQPGTVTVQTYGVTALPGAVTMLVADWSALLALLVLSWRVPRWRRRLVGITIVVLSVLLLLTLGEGQTAVAASGLARQYPDTELLPGAWLALLGAGLIGGAIAVPATPRPLAASQSDQPSGDPIAIVGPARGAPASPTVTEPEPASPMPPTAGWSVRPVRQPWWRRPGPRIALLTGAAAVVLVIGAVAWLAVQTPAAPRDHSGDLRGFLLPLPPGATLSAIDGQLDAASIDDNPIAPIAVQQGGIQQIAVERWLETSGQGRVSVGWCGSTRITGPVRSCPASCC